MQRNNSEPLRREGQNNEVAFPRKWTTEGPLRNNGRSAFEYGELEAELDRHVRTGQLKYWSGGSNCDTARDNNRKVCECRGEAQ
jgi:hypothetical protein